MDRNLPSHLVLAAAAVFADAMAAQAPTVQVDSPFLAGRAVLPADTFAPGPTSGQYIQGANGVSVPFRKRQPVQGF